MSYSLGGITTATDDKRRSIYYRNGWVKTTAGFQIAAIRIDPIVCSKGQRISFDGRLSYHYEAGDWYFTGQAPELPSAIETKQPDSTKKKG